MIALTLGTLALALISLVVATRANTDAHDARLDLEWLRRKVDNLPPQFTSPESVFKLIRLIDAEIGNHENQIQLLNAQVNADDPTFEFPPITIREGMDGVFYWQVGNQSGAVPTWDEARAVSALEAACQFFKIQVRQPARVQELSSWSNQ